MSALVRACQNRQVPAEVALVVSPKADSPAVQAAKDLGVPVSVMNPADPDYAGSLVSLLQAEQIEWVCLAGLMTKLPPEFLAAYHGRILNIHPSLLPKFGGKGMYGMHVHRAVLESGDDASGCSVHIVTEEYDEGPLVLQLTCPVMPGDSAETLAARVLELEHEAFPAALKSVIESHAAKP